jgi:hypothetical protein
MRGTIREGGGGQREGGGGQREEEKGWKRGLGRVDMIIAWYMHIWKCYSKIEPSNLYNQCVIIIILKWFIALPQPDFCQPSTGYKSKLQK